MASQSVQIEAGFPDLTSHAKELLSGLHLMRQKDHLLDITITVEGQSFKVNCLMRAENIESRRFITSS